MLLWPRVVLSYPISCPLCDLRPCESRVVYRAFEQRPQARRGHDQAEPPAFSGRARKMKRNGFEHELELIQLTRMPMLRAEVHTNATRESEERKEEMCKRQEA